MLGDGFGFMTKEFSPIIIETRNGFINVYRPGAAIEFNEFIVIKYRNM